LCGDFPTAMVVEDEAGISALPFSPRFGVVAQTTQPLAKVTGLVESLKQRHPAAEVVFKDTVCQPTKDRQLAMDRLCKQNNIIVVIGGRNSNNTRQLSETARKAGIPVHQIETADDLQAAWFNPAHRVGVTAGTSTLDETVTAVVARLKAFSAGQQGSSTLGRLPGMLQRAAAALI